MARGYVIATYRRPWVARLCVRLFGHLMFESKHRCVRKFFQSAANWLGGLEIR
jgi:hypothetical protein